jgi:hypothetical protein
MRFKRDIQILATVPDAGRGHIDPGQSLRGSLPRPRDAGFLFEHESFPNRSLSIML